MNIIYISVLFLIFSSGCFADSKMQCEVTQKFSNVIIQANAILETAPITVTSKTDIGHGDSLNDYISLATYWWPDPSSDNGLPYIRKDGLTNPESENDQTDKAKLYSFRKMLRSLTFAYLLTNEDKYINKAIELLDTWFVNPKTRMNPHMKYGQAIKGINRGRAEGLIDAAVFADVAIYIKLLNENSKINNIYEIRKWYEAFLSWILESEIGKTENNAENNHGTYYDFQVIAYMLFLDKKYEAKKFSKKSINKRIEQQIHTSGRQPLEKARSRAWHYSNFNLTAFGKIYLLLDNKSLKNSIKKTNRTRLKKAYQYMVENTEELITQSNIDENESSLSSITNKLIYYYFFKNDRLNKEIIRKSILSEHSIDFHLLTKMKKINEVCN